MSLCEETYYAGESGAIYIKPSKWVMNFNSTDVSTANGTIDFSRLEGHRFNSGDKVELVQGEAGTLPTITPPTVVGNFAAANVNDTTDVITISAHGFNTGDAVVATGSNLPAPLVASTTYFVIKLTADTLKLATTKANALTGTAINITTTGGAGSVLTLSVLGYYYVVKVDENLIKLASTRANALTATALTITNAGTLNCHRVQLVDYEKGMQIRNWQASFDKDILDTTTLGQKVRSRIGSMINGTGSFTILYSNRDDVSKRFMKDALMYADPGNARVQLYLSEADKRYIEGKVIISNVQMGATPGELIEASCNFEFNGEYELVNF